MEPIPETAEALRELQRWDEPSDLRGGLVRLCGRARGVVPDLVGVSITRLEEGFTFTLVASSDDLAALDAVQVLGGGPCVEGAHTGRVQTFDDEDALDEERWRLFAEASAGRGVRSTLTLPLVLADGRSGTVNLYAASPTAFVGHHDELATVFGAWAEAAVVNADLGFQSLAEARATPGRVRELGIIQAAIGRLAARLDVSVEAAEERFWDAAARAAVAPVELARTILDADGEAP